jgi:hypothetical protein
MMTTTLPNQLSLPFGVRIRPKLRLSQVEDLIKQHRIVVPCPSRQTLIRMCEEGVLETPGRTPGLSGWLVYEDSFWQWAGCDAEPLAA